jgi:hypothetical protein
MGQRVTCEQPGAPCYFQRSEVSLQSNAVALGLLRAVEGHVESDVVALGLLRAVEGHVECDVVAQQVDLGQLRTASALTLLF